MQHQQSRRGGASRAATGPQRPARRVAMATMRLGLLLGVALSLSACDKCGRITKINKPWSSACEAGPVTQ